MSSKDTSPGGSTTSMTANTTNTTTNTSNKVKIVSKSESVVSSGQEVNGEISNESNQDVKENKNDSNVSSSKKKKGNFDKFYVFKKICKMFVKVCLHSAQNSLYFDELFSFITLFEKSNFCSKIQF